MNGRSGRIAGIVLVGVLVCPGIAHASLWDLIWKMSGPQMSGIPLHCEWVLGNIESQRTRDLRAKGLEGPPDTRGECRFLDIRFTGYAKPRNERQTPRELWLSLDTGPYWSTGKDPHGGVDPDYKHGEVWMVAAEPILEVRSKTWRGGSIALDHGILGATYHLFFGDDFGTFDKGGLKFKPAVVTIGRWNATATVRWYLNGTTPDEFGKTSPRQDINRPNEWVYGFSLGYLFRR